MRHDRPSAPTGSSRLCFRSGNHARLAAAADVQQTLRTSSAVAQPGPSRMSATRTHSTLCRCRPRQPQLRRHATLQPRDIKRGAESLYRLTVMLMSRREGLRAKSHVEAPGGTSAGSRNAAGPGFDSPRRLPLGDSSLEEGTNREHFVPDRWRLCCLGHWTAELNKRAPTRRTGRARSSRAQNGAQPLSASLDSACAAPLAQTRRRPSTAIWQRPA